MLEILSFGTIFLFGLVAGGMLADLLVLHPEQRTLPGQQNLDLHDASLKRVDQHRPPMIALSMVFAIMLLIFDNDLSSMEAAGLGVGTACALAISLSGIPASRVRASSDSPEEIAERLDRLHIVRTAVSIVALIAFILAGLAD